MQIIDCLLSKNTTKEKTQEEIVLTNSHLPYDDGAGKKESYGKEKHEALKSTKINVIPKILAAF